MNTLLKRMSLGAMGLLLVAPFATHAETLQQVTDQGNNTTNPIVFSGGSSTDLFESAGLKLFGESGYGDFGGYPTKLLNSSPNGNYWNEVSQNEYANTNAAAPSAWGQYVTDDGDLQLWSVNGPGGASHEFLVFATPEQEVGWATGGPGGIYIPEAGLVFGPFQSNSNDLGLPNAEWRNLYVGGVDASNVTTTNLNTATLAVDGAGSMGSFGGFPAKFTVTSPNEGVWTMVEQNAAAKVNNPTTAESWGSFIANDGTYSFYAINSSVGYMQFATTEQLVANGDPAGVGGIYVGPSGGTFAPWENNSLDLGLPADSWKNVYASGTVVSVGLNVSSQTRLPSDTLINNTAVCLADGTNCPAMFMAQASQIQPPAPQNTDVDGQAKIVKNGLTVQVTFATAYENAPAVVVTPREFVDGAYRVTDVKKTGFTIEFNKKQNKDVLLDWHASGIELKTVFVGKKAN